MKLRKISKVFMLTGAITLMAVSMMKIDAAAAEIIDINEKNFPDPTFRKYVLDICDKNKDRILDSEEITAATKMELNGVEDDETGAEFYYDIRDYTGIEYFTNLRELYCEPNDVNELNLSANKQLEIFSCSDKNYKAYCKLKKLDLSQNTKLKEVYCIETDLQELKLPKNNQIEILDVKRNKLKKLDVRSLVHLKKLIIFWNKIDKIDVTRNRNLEIFDCSGNKISSLKLKTNKNLKILECSYNPIKSLDVSSCKNLKELNARSAKLTSLDVSSNRKLQKLAVTNNQLKTLNVSKNLKLKFLDCMENNIKKLNLFKNSKLKEYYADKGINRIAPKAVFKNKKAKITTLERKGKNKVRIDVKKVKDAAGYQISYSTNKKFSNVRKITSNKRSITLKEMKSNKKYYIKVRAFMKNPKGKKIYSKNSEIKEI